MQTDSVIERTENKTRGTSKWGGLVLVALGALLFTLNVVEVSLENWWALFILMPALALFGWGRKIGRGVNGRLPFLARLNFAIGLIILVVAVMFLINLDWSVWWPLMLISPGLALLIAIGRGSENPAAAAWSGYLRWVAVTLIGLGVVFLAQAWGVIDLDTLGQFRWWGVFIAIPTLGALLQAVRLSGRLGHISVNAIILLFIAFVTGGAAVMELLGLSWEMWPVSWTSLYEITAVFFIGMGVLLLANGLRRQNQ